MPRALVVSLHGRRLPDVAVRFLDPRRGAVTAEARTDAQGRVQIESDPARLRLVQVVARSSTITVLDRFAQSAAVTRAVALPSDGTLDIAGHRNAARVAIASLGAVVLRRVLGGCAPAHFGRVGGNPIRVVYPDGSPARLAFVAPVSWPGGGPLVRLQKADVSSLGVPDTTVLAHELAHAVHFGVMPLPVRARVAATYLGWLARQVATGGDPTHAPNRTTMPLAAWVEAFGLFGQRFDAFTVRVGSGLPAEQLHREFVEDESVGGPRLAAASNQSMLGDYVGTSPDLTDAQHDIEGSVYMGAIIARATVVGLPRAVADYLHSGRAGVTTLGGYRRFLALRA